MPDHATAEPGPKTPSARPGALGPGGRAPRPRGAGTSALGAVTSAVGAAKTLTDRTASGSDKLATGGRLAAEAIGSAVGSPVLGKVAGRLAGTKAGKGVVAAIAAVLVLAVLLTVVTVGAVVQGAVLVASDSSGKSDTGADGGCLTLAPVASLAADQQANAQAIVQTVVARHLSAGDAVIAIMTALTESGLRNVDHGDLAGPDSRGLFQQRDSWGPLEVRMDPAGATGLFLDRLTAPALLLYEGPGISKTVAVNASADSRAALEPWRVAQSVQISAFPMGENYRDKYPQAVTVVATMLGQDAVDMTAVDHWLDVAGLTLPDSAAGSGATSAPASDPTSTPAPGDEQASGGCGAPAQSGGTAPGAWGGFQNGQIPPEAMCALSWTVTTSAATTRYLECGAAAALERLNVAYRAQFGTNLSVNVAYRDLATQRDLYFSGGGTGPAAFPGTSNHGWAKAIDINGTSASGGTYEQRKTTVVYRWMAANAPAFGWRENVKLQEAWHWEFWGATTG